MGDGPVAFLASCIPDLYFGAFVVEHDCFGGKLHADGGLGVLGELVLFEAGEEVGFSDPGICLLWDGGTSDDNHLEQVVEALSDDAHIRTINGYCTGSSKLGGVKFG